MKTDILQIKILSILFNTNYMLTILSPFVPFTESVTICDVIQGLFYKQPLPEQTASCFQNSSVQPLFLTSFGIPITFQYSLFEDWALAKHWHSMFTSLLDNSKSTFFCHYKIRLHNFKFTVQLTGAATRGVM